MKSELLIHASSEVLSELNIIEGVDVTSQKYAECLKAELEEFQSIATAVEKNDTIEGQLNSANQLVGSMQMIDSASQLLEAHLLSLTQTLKVSRFKKWVSETLIPWANKMWKLVWGFLQKMVIPKEWKLKGGLGTGFLGLANAEVEIKFY
jgi:hypothetical protein